ncbi:tetratricopeptide repeat protein [Hymenobacter crusticola]|uniref:Uncharacterized protein n=1 Tax=Hymenobacter crusticola TaxID=1770526 RepID=A0A243WE10_9BACT|nr:tetratricopeptide repeat protein [Hymenobacter crusticola]OUJ73700.1 hypothetical protein BXP70_11980 [Hymenobacter crusticola]
MNSKPWKLSLLAVLSVSASAVVAQDVQSARKAIELEQFGQARASLLKQGSSPEAAYELGRLYQLREVPDSAAYYFNRVPVNPKDAFSLVAAGRAALAQGKTAEAEAQFDNAVKASKGKDAKIFTLIAQAYAESDVKDITKATTYVDAGQKANKGKDEPALMIARGDIYQKTDAGGGEAMNSYERASMADPNNVEAYYKKGELNFRSRNYNEARTNFEKAISLDPKYAPAYRDLAEMYYFANQYQLALDTFKKYQEVAERSSETDAEYASFLFLTKKYPEALTEIQKVLQKEPNNIAMNRLLAYSLYETGQNDQAMAAMDKYMKMVPADKLIKDDNLYYGKMLSKAGRDDEALALLQKAAQASPKDASEIQGALAQTYMQKKDYAKAVAAYKAKIGTGTPLLTDQVLLATAYSGNKQYQQADSLYNLVLTARPTYAPGYQMRASNAYYMDPDSKQGTARPYWEKYVELAKADPAKYKDGLTTAYEYLGYYYFQKGDKATALPYYQQLLALDPSNARAKAGIESIQGKKTTTSARK